MARKACSWNNPEPRAATLSRILRNQPNLVARYFTPSGRSIQAKGIAPDIEILQEEPDDLKARTDSKGEASLRGHLKSEGSEESGSQSYVPPDEKDDRALKEALDLLRGTITDSAFPPNPKAAVP
jgi:carboxyl-terminal processing protease